MGYFDLVLSDPLFAQLVIAGLLIFGVFGAWLFYGVYILFVFITFFDPVVMQYSMIVLAGVMAFHYFVAAVSVVSSDGQKSPFRDVT